jgi:hypothetical protein
MHATQALNDCVAALEEGDLLESELCWDEFIKNATPTDATLALTALPAWALEKLEILTAFTEGDADFADVTHRG